MGTPTVTATAANPAETPDDREMVYEWFRAQPWTEEAYLSIAETSNRPVEYSDHRLLIVPVPTLTHQRVLRRFAELMGGWLRQRDVGELLFAPHPIRLWPGKYREPDVMVWLSEHRDRMAERASGPPDLVMEILSPGSVALDREVKYEAYAQAGVTEYWMVNPTAQRVFVFALERSSYRLQGHYASGDTVRSVILPGFALSVDDLFREE
jgi:Uma2 family endonuclease